MKMRQHVTLAAFIITSYVFVFDKQVQNLCANFIVCL